MGFNAETYWADKPVKKFSIVLRNGTTEQNMIVAARNEDAARAAALENTFLDASAAVVVSAQLATPEDLGLSIQQDQNLITERDLAAENRRLRAALSDCVDMMQQCQQWDNEPLLDGCPIGSVEWDITVAMAYQLLSEKH